MRTVTICLVSALALVLAGCGAPPEEPVAAPEDKRDVVEPAKLKSAVPNFAAPAVEPGLVMVRHTAAAVAPLQRVDTEVPAAWTPLVAEGELPPASPDAVPLADTDGQLDRAAGWWCRGAVVRWNEIAREVVAQHQVNSSMSARLFGALSVAQHDALLRARMAARAAPVASGDPARLIERGCGRVERNNPVAQEAAIAWASARVLSHLVPKAQRFLLQNEAAHLATREWMGASSRSELEAGRILGEQVALKVIARLQQDGASEAKGPSVPKLEGKWYEKYQTLPTWSRVKPWLLESAAQFRAPAPPALTSAEFEAALAEIRQLSELRSAEQLAIARFWDLGVGGISVPGMWNQVGLDQAEAQGWSELQTVRLLTILNTTLHDTSIACWDSKYHYLVPRPSMRDPAITEPLGLPPHPSYPSGHSAFSGAAAEVLATAFPQRAGHFRSMAEEASASRFYGGIHYRFDGDAGLEQGRQVARLVLQKLPLELTASTAPIAERQGNP